MATRLNRRDFLRRAALAGTGLLILRDPKSAWSYQANNRLNIAAIGAGGQGGGLVNTFAGMGENIVALCDVDDRRAAETYKRFPNAKRYKDFRKMLDELHGQIDAVVVATPDHTHAVASIAAMKLGKHVYCEKPLTWCIGEARAMRKAAIEHKVVTQMGNQGTASEGLRQAVEIVRAGVLGQVREVHVWSNRPIWPQGIDRPKDTPPVSLANWIGICGLVLRPIALTIPPTCLSLGGVGATLGRGRWATWVATPLTCLSWR